MSIRKIERLIGYLTIDYEEYPFEYVEDSSYVILFPPTIEKWSEIAGPFYFFEKINEKSSEKGWIKSRRVEGLTSEGYRIWFSIKDSPSNYHGFLSYEVEWYYYCKNDFDVNQINGFRVSGAEIDYFYPPQIALQNDIEFGEGRSVKKMQVSTSDDQSEKLCGAYSIRRGLRAEITVNAFATMHYNTAYNPIEAKSYLFFAFSSATGLDDLITAYYQVKCFLKYITYRKNAEVDVLETFFVNNEDKRDYAGMLVFPTKHMEEKSEKASERILSYYVFEKKTSSLFSAIKQSKMGYAHICDSIDDRRHYSSGRMIMIMAEFEREYRDIYGQDYGRSKLYLSTKQEIVEIIDRYKRCHTGDSKKYAQSIKRTVQNLDNSYAQNVEYAINDCKSIMEPFFKKNYNIGMDNSVREMSVRVGEIRNGIAHSKMDFELDAIHLTDIKIIEELIYAIRLKKLGVPEINIKRGINALFMEDIAV